VWDDSGRNGKDAQKKKIGKANEKRKKRKSKKEQTRMLAINVLIPNLKIARLVQF